MSHLLYKHTIGGDGVAQGLPLRRGSQLYDVEPNLRYPLVLSTGLDSDLHTYDRGIYLRVPHLPITFIVEPYISNHRAGGSNFTRRQYFTIKRGQPLMAVTKREATIGVFSNAGVVSTKTYVDPAKLETDGKLVGYTNGTVVMYNLKDGADAGAGAPARITKAAYGDLPEEAAAGTPDQTDYEGDTVYTIAEFDALPDEAKQGFRGVYEGLTDTNDKIATGGENMYAAVEEALYGSTNLVKYYDIDADTYYFGAATRSDGFIFPSTGGAKRTVFFNEVDAEAGVTLPTDGSGQAPSLVVPIGNTTNVSTGNAAAWYRSAVELPLGPTVGVAHTDLEQTLSHKWHMFSTGTDVHSPVRKGRLQIPFVNLVKLRQILSAEVPGETFNITDMAGNRSGLKVGLSLSTPNVSVQNKYSLLTSADAGYANLYYNFAAPFLMTNRDVKLKDKIVPDLFGNYVLAKSGALSASATDGAGNDFGVSGADRTNNIDGTVTWSDDHICGSVTLIHDIPRRALLHLAVNPIFQSRIIGGAERNYLNEGYRRVRGADNAGMEPILSDFLLMLLGGANFAWASQLLPKFGGVGQDIAKILEIIVLEGAAGIVEIALDVL